MQLHGMGLSLINVLCSQLTVTARKQDATLRMLFRDGNLCEQELIEGRSEVTGNTISGTVDRQFRKRGLDQQALRRWLLDILAASQSLRLFFHGEEMGPQALGHAPQ